MADNLVTYTLRHYLGHTASAPELCDTLVRHGMTRKNAQLAMQRMLDEGRVRLDKNLNFTLKGGDDG